MKSMEFGWDNMVRISHETRALLHMRVKTRAFSMQPACNITQKITNNQCILILHVLIRTKHFHDVLFLSTETAQYANAHTSSTESKAVHILDQYSPISLIVASVLEVAMVMSQYTSSISMVTAFLAISSSLPVPPWNVADVSTLYLLPSLLAQNQ